MTITVLYSSTLVQVTEMILRRLIDSVKTLKITKCAKNFLARRDPQQAPSFSLLPSGEEK